MCANVWGEYVYACLHVCALVRGWEEGRHASACLCVGAGLCEVCVYLCESACSCLHGCLCVVSSLTV